MSCTKITTGLYTVATLILTSLAVVACEFSKGPEKLPSQKGEYLYRTSGEVFFSQEPPQKNASELYPWQRRCQPISKEYFRCKGQSMHPPKFVGQLRLSDCRGIDEHSLPIKQDKEFIYPILIELLNAIQERTGKKVVINAGHRCLAHHQYVTNGQGAVASKHLLGAAVTFYVEGFEERPEEIIDLVQAYFSDQAIYAGVKEYVAFQRWDTEKTDVSTAPWYNKEIFIKLYGKEEGRDEDHAHTFPYISIQVRYDRLENKKVIYSDTEGLKNCWRR